jgi:hypothetical protein
LITTVTLSIEEVAAEAEEAAEEGEEPKGRKKGT